MDQIGFYTQQISDFVGVRTWPTGYFLSLIDSTKEADKGNIRSFTAQVNCLFRQMLPFPLTRAQEWGYAFLCWPWPLFHRQLRRRCSSGWPEELLPLRHLPGDSMSNLTVAPLAARAYRLSRRDFFELSDDQRPSRAFLIA